RERGDTPREAAARGTGEVALAVLTATCTTIIVFLPAIFLVDDHNARVFLTTLGKPIAFALLSSLAVALILIPLGAIYLRRRKDPPRAKMHHEPRGMRRLYVRMLSGAMRRRVLVVAIAFAFLYGAVVVAMPNLHPEPLTRPEMVNEYQGRILRAAPALRPIVPLYLTQGVRPHDIDAARLVTLAAKYYPSGVTTNSGHGPVSLDSIAPAFERMAELDMLLLIHGEVPGAPYLDAEREFVESELPWLDRHFPTLRVVLEHVTTGDAVQWVKEKYRAVVKGSI
ncbi:MAG: efflux RND transporter permease subunit, partial [Planctomycetes bacterium]|nr:efflux RND transporter permease subunit [Planctomycetota bacterium]